MKSVSEVHGWGRRIGGCILIGGLLVGATSAQAWGRQGHKVVALIAEEKLTPVAREKTEEILALENSKTLSDISSWADDVKQTYPYLPSHAVRIPFDADMYDQERDCSRKRKCIVEAIYMAERVLKDEKESQRKKLVSLKLLVHYLGDIHQPLHAIKQTGQMNVNLGGRTYKLHKVWDTISVDFLGHSPEKISKNILSSGGTVDRGSPVSWAEESHKIARQYIYHNDESLANSSVIYLPKGYLNEISPVIEQRLYTAGIRLAMEINSIYQ